MPGHDRGVEEDLDVGGPDGAGRCIGPVRPEDKVAVQVRGLDGWPAEAHALAGDVEQLEGAWRRRRLYVRAGSGDDPRGPGHGLPAPTAVGGDAGSHGMLAERLGLQRPLEDRPGLAAGYRSRGRPRPGRIRERVGPHGPEADLQADTLRHALARRVSLHDGFSRDGAVDRREDDLQPADRAPIVVKQAAQLGLGEGQLWHRLDLVRAGRDIAGGVQRHDDVVIEHPIPDARVDMGRVCGLPDRLVAASAEDRAKDAVALGALDRAPGQLDAARAGLGGQVARGIGRPEVSSRRAQEHGDRERLQRDRGDAVGHGHRVMRAKRIGEHYAVRDTVADVDGDLAGSIAQVECHDRRRTLAATQVGERPGGIIGMEEGQVSLAERLVLGTQPRQRPVVVTELAGPRHPRGRAGGRRGRRSR